MAGWEISAEYRFPLRIVLDFDDAKIFLMIRSPLQHLTRIIFATLLFTIAGCSTAPVQTGSIKLQFAYKKLQPTVDSLYPIFPNPFNRASGDTGLCIEFAIADSVYPAELLIQNALGDPVAEFSDSAVSSGVYTGWWDPIAADGTPLMSGIYFVTVQNGAFINSRLVSLQENE